MKLTHSGDDSLSGIRVSVCSEGWIFLSQLGESNTHLLLTGLGLRLNGNLDYRIREFHRFEDDRFLLITERISCCSLLETYSCSNISGVNLLDFLSVVSVHLQDSSDSLTLTLSRIVYVRTRLKCS